MGYLYGERMRDLASLLEPSCELIKYLDLVEHFVPSTIKDYRATIWHMKRVAIIYNLL